MQTNRRRRAVSVAVALAAAVMLTATAPDVRSGTVLGDAQPRVETDPVGSVSDAADDAALWRHPDDPALSLVIGTDKRGGAVEVYDLAGTRLQRIGGARANGVDLRHGVPFAGGLADLVAVGGDDVRFFRVDAVARQLLPVPIGHDGTRGDPNGLCLYRSPTGKLFMFGISLRSEVDQLEVVDQGGALDLRPVRKVFDVGSDSEACVADDDLGALYVNEADFDLWRYGAEPDAGNQRVSVDQVGGRGHLVADVEGLALVHQPDGTGYLIASSQGEDAFAVYQREGDNAYVGKFRVEGGKMADGCSNTDGIEAWAGDLGPSFPQGIFVCQDHTNSGPHSGNQNFKFTRLEDVLALAPAGPGGPVDVPGDPPSGPEPVRPGVPAPDHPAPVPSRATGYWMLGANGKVHAFGAPAVGDAAGRLRAGVNAVDLAATPSGDGYWILDRAGTVTARGDAVTMGGLPPRSLAPGEAATSLSATPSGRGYWIFTSLGRAVPFGDAAVLGDMRGTPLNGAVIDSVATPTGHGYYMVAADGGIFTFGDARFAGSMGNRRLNAPVRSLVPDPEGNGYWLVASDGGVFSFDAPFKGSMGDRRLNQPITGMIGFGSGYLMVAADGGIFNFSDRPFLGSLGDRPPADPIVSVASGR